MRTYHLTIAKVGENVFEGDVVSATIPGVEGAFTVLAGHEAFVSEIKEGSIYVRAEGKQAQEFHVETRGIAEVSGNQATVLL
jgi:F-type H+-transporting ATPase subunit epsilon